MFFNKKGLGIALISDRVHLKNAVPSAVACLLSATILYVFATWRYFSALGVLISGFDDPMAQGLRLFFVGLLVCVIAYAIFTFVPEFAN